MHTNELHFISWHLKRIRHNLNLSQMVARVELSNGLLSTLKKEKHQNFNYNFTGDKPQIYLSNDHKVQQVHEEECISIRRKKMIWSKKSMLFVFWNTKDFLVIDLLPEGMKFNDQYFIKYILERIYQITANLCLKSSQKFTLHIDNA